MTIIDRTPPFYLEPGPGTHRPDWRQPGVEDGHGEAYWMRRARRAETQLRAWSEFAVRLRVELDELLAQAGNDCVDRDRQGGGDASPSQPDRPPVSPYLTCSLGEPY